MLPKALVGTYVRYKEDTDAIAHWLATTAQSLGFTEGVWVAAFAAPADPSAGGGRGGGRPKGKARSNNNTGNKSKSQPAPSASALPSTVPNSSSSSSPPTKKKWPSPIHLKIPEFVPLARFIAAKSAQVPNWLRPTLDRAIASRSGFGELLQQHGQVLDLQKDYGHKHFVDVLRQVRNILRPYMQKGNFVVVPQATLPATSTLADRFSDLDIFESSWEFLDAPDCVRAPEPPTDGTPIFDIRHDDTLEEAVFAVAMLVKDLNFLRSRIRWIWSSYKIGAIELAAAAVATNTAIELVKGFADEVMPLVDKNGGLNRILSNVYILQLSLQGWKLDDIYPAGAPDGGTRSYDFNPDTYDTAESTFFGAYRLLEASFAFIEPSDFLVFKDGFFGSYDPHGNVPHAQKSGADKFADDRALVMPLFRDLLTMMRYIRDWPVRDALLTGMREMETTGAIPLYAVFAVQAFLDTTYTLGTDVSRPRSRLLAHMGAINNDLDAHLEFHEALKISNWPAANDAGIKQVQQSIQLVSADPIAEAQDIVKSFMGLPAATGAAKTGAHRYLGSSPVMCGLLLYHFRAHHREIGLLVADAWGSIRCAQHLYNALSRKGMLDKGPLQQQLLRWRDMDVVQLALGDESFAVGGQTPTEYFNMFCLQMGTSAAVFARRHNRQQFPPLESRSGRRGLRPGVPVHTMFAERYQRDRDVGVTADFVETIVRLSLYQREGEDDDGRFTMGQIDDDAVVRERKQKAAAAKNKLASSADGVAEAADTPITLNKLIKMLTLSLNAETIRFAFPFLHMHRLCRQLLRSVKERCHPLLTELYTDQYIEHENQLP
ncbi:DUF6604 domain-containing protein [Microdochium nivale]|nr:DUF6604 domain-containing protein [Microdochium nivale]